MFACGERNEGIVDDRSAPPSPGAQPPEEPEGGAVVPEHWYRPAPSPGPGNPAPPAGHGPEGFGPAPPTAHGAEPVAAPPRRRRWPLFAGLAGFLVLALVGGAVSWYVLTRPEPEETAQAYAQAWDAEDYSAMAEVATGDADPVEEFTAVAENLGVEDTQVELGETVRDGDTARAPYTTTLALENAGEWSYEGELPLELTEGEWRVAFSPAVIHPELGEGQTLDRSNEWGDRGQVLAADGSRLDTEDVSGSIQMLIGAVRPAEAEDLEDLGSAYAEGDPIGGSGVQRAYQDRLAGTPTTQVVVASAGAEEEDAGEEDPAVVGTIDGEAGEDVHTTLDMEVHNAAAQAITGQDDPTAMVALRPSTGELLAAVNVPGDYNRALNGQYPPGSAFKIVSYEALLNSGMGMDTTLECPETTDVGGWEFRNAGEAEYGEQTVEEAFATSCNTALVQEMDERLDGAGLVGAAEEFGFNAPLDIGIPSFDPEFPAPDSATLLAAMSIGQGQMLTSPLHMATVPAAVADGQWRSPILISEPELTDQPEPRPLGHAEELRTMMRSVVTEGTAEDAGFSGDVYGKTGSAEYGTPEDEDDELDSHAWFVGFDGERDLAFAVVVEGGGAGSSEAAPLAADFLDAL